MKKSKLILALILAIIVLMVAAPAAHAASNGWAWQQETAHQIAELARTLGLPEGHPLIAICQDIWWAYHDATDVNKIGTYTSSRTGQTYGYNANGTNYCLGKDLATGLTYRYGGYTWFQSKANYSWFRIETTNGTSKLVWATKSQNSSIPEYGSWVSNAQYPADGWYSNIVDGDTGKLETYENGAKSTFGGKKLYDGIIEGIDQYIDVNEATCLARLMYTAGHAEQSTTKVAGIGWSVVDYIGVGNINATKLKSVYGFYNNEAPTTDENGRDYLALAKDILYRKLAEKSGMTWVGRVIPNNWTYIWQYGNGTCDLFQNESRTSAYTFPNRWTSNNSLMSPYYN